MITVHHLNHSRSQRVLWLLEEIGTPYQVKHYERDARTMLAPASLRDVHPLGKSPVISDDGQVVAESGAIVEYLVERFGPSLAPPPGTPERLRYTYWLHYAEGSAMPPLLLSLVFGKLPKSAPLLVRPLVHAIAGQVTRRYIRPQLDAHLGFMEAQLGKSLWFAGDHFSAADIQMSFPIEAAASRGGFDGARPRLQAYLERIHARPAYQRALISGGPFAILS